MQEACQGVKRKKQWEGNFGEGGAAVERGSLWLTYLDVDPMQAEDEDMEQIRRGE